MPRIDDRFLDCSIYLYRNQASAMEAAASGGAGFLVALSAEKCWVLPGKCPQRDFHHLYAVSNRHVVEKSPVVRLNTHDGTFDIIPLESSNWIVSQEDDVAICPLEYQRAYKFVSIGVDDFLTEEWARRHDIGIGDEVFMVGRFINHAGKQRNLPALRWGHVSMMPFEPLYHPTNPTNQQESFLVEVHSISGFSGSPLFVRPVASHKVSLRESATNTAVTGIIGPSSGSPWLGPWLLGIDWGYINKHDQQQNNTGMSGVVPAWKLRALLESEHVRSIRAIEQQGLIDRYTARGTSLA